jgi:dolichol-phosphate mannosyltransferase
MSYEIVFVDDGSKDKTVKEIQKLQSKHDNIRLAKLSRNFGSHAAILAGLSITTGDVATFISADLQDPPEIIMQMLGKWQNGADSVIAVREDREESFIQKFFSNTYYRIMRKIALKNMPLGGFDCFMIDRKVINTIVRMNEKNTSLMGLILWSGYKIEEIRYVRKARELGKSRWTFGKKVKYFTDSMVSFSFFPLKAITIIGILFSLISAIWMIAILISWLVGRIPVQGFTTLILVILFSSGLILFSLGMIGEYLWRILDATRERPTFIIDEIIEPKGRNKK